MILTNMNESTKIKFFVDNNTLHIESEKDTISRICFLVRAIVETILESQCNGICLKNMKCNTDSWQYLSESLLLNANLQTINFESCNIAEAYSSKLSTKKKLVKIDGLVIKPIGV